MLRPEDCKPGTLVECISMKLDPAWTSLQRGGVYTIEALVKSHFDVRTMEERDRWAIFLHEVHEPCRCTSGRLAYGLGGFRLLPDSRLAVFRAMLSPIPMKELSNV